MLQKLIKRFSNVEQVPIEIEEIVNALIDFGIQDEIRLFPDDDMDTAALLGTYYQYTRRDTIYGDPILCSLIVYGGKLSSDWQRMICCKELVHILDHGSEKVVTAEALDGLTNRLLGLLSTEDVSIVDLMAAKDRLALYQAIPLLFPEAARVAALAAISRGEKTVKDVSEQVCLPESLVTLALTDGWPDIVRALCC
jgi:hypothetical protein